MRINHRGISLLEVFLAVAVLMLAVIPLFRHSSHDAVTAIETERISQAEHILQSVQEELSAMPFTRFNVATEGTEEPGPFILPSGFFPVTYSQILDLQSKFKDFDVVGTWSYIVRDGKVNRNMVQVDYMARWSSPSGTSIERKRSRLIVRP